MRNTRQQMGIMRERKSFSNSVYSQVGKAGKAQKRAFFQKLR